MLVVPLGTLLDVAATWLFGHKQALVAKKVDWQELKNVKAVVPGSDGLEEYHVRVDELQAVQTRRTKFLHAARYRRIQEMTDLVNPMTEAERLTDIIKEKLEADPVIDLTSAVPGKPETEPMSLMDSPSNLKMTVKAKDRYKAIQGVGYRNQNRLAVELYNSRNGEETKDADGGMAIGMGNSSLDRIDESLPTIKKKPLRRPMSTPPPRHAPRWRVRTRTRTSTDLRHTLDPLLLRRQQRQERRGGATKEVETAASLEEGSSALRATTMDSDDMDSEEAELAAHEAMKATDNTAQSLHCRRPRSRGGRAVSGRTSPSLASWKILHARVSAMSMKEELQLPEDDEEKETRW